MPSYTISYPHPVSKVTWYPVDHGICINIVAAADEISPPKSPELKAVEGDIEEERLDGCPRTSSAVSLVVHHSGLDLFGQSSTVVRTAERVLPEREPPSSCEITETDSIAILTPSHTTAGMYNSRVVRPRCVHFTGEEGSMSEQCDCLRVDKLETLQGVLAEERKDRPTFEERVKTPIVSPPRDVLTDTAIASFDLAFPEFQAGIIHPQSERPRQFEVSWEDLD